MLCTIALSGPSRCVNSEHIPVHLQRLATDCEHAAGIIHAFLSWSGLSEERAEKTGSIWVLFFPVDDTGRKLKAPEDLSKSIIFMLRNQVHHRGPVSDVWTHQWWNSWIFDSWVKLFFQWKMKSFLIYGFLSEDKVSPFLTYSLWANLMYKVHIYFTVLYKKGGRVLSKGSICLEMSGWTVLHENWWHFHSSWHCPWAEGALRQFSLLSFDGLGSGAIR